MDATLMNPTLELFAELDYRENDGIEVSLLWNRSDDTLTVRVNDTRTTTVFELPVGPGQARDVFDHPYAHAGNAAALQADHQIAATHGQG